MQKITAAQVEALLTTGHNAIVNDDTDRTNVPSWSVPVADAQHACADLWTTGYAFTYDDVAMVLNSRRSLELRAYFDAMPCRPGDTITASYRTGKMTTREFTVRVKYTWPMDDDRTYISDSSGSSWVVLTRSIRVLESATAG